MYASTIIVASFIFLRYLYLQHKLAWL